MTDEPLFTSTSLVGSAAQILKGGGYRQLVDQARKFWDSPNTKLFEDENGIVALVVYETWQDLLSEWESAQAILVDLISKYVSSGEPKAWDGYLVLLTPSPVATETELERIRYDVTRVRKIVATGNELPSRTHLEWVLAPLLPLSADLVADEQDDVIARLPNDIESEKDIPGRYVKAVVDAFLNGEPMIGKLDEARRNG